MSVFLNGGRTTSRHLFSTRPSDDHDVMVTWTISFKQSFLFIILEMKRMTWEINGVHLKI